MVARSPKRTPKTAEEEALEKRQSLALDKEIEEQEERLGLFKRRSLGRASLLSGAAKTAASAAGEASAAVVKSTPKSLFSASQNSRQRGAPQ